MRFVCLVHVSEAALEALSDEEMHKLDADSLAYDRVLEQSGHMVVAHALKSPSQALCLRSRGGRVISTDGPYAETKEQLLGFILIDARDQNDAIAVAGKIPCGAYGTIELREVHYLRGEETPEAS